MDRKYLFVEESRLMVGHQLHRIRALKDIVVYVKTGDLGGWIEVEGNLSETGDAWVAGEAQVYGAARVSDDALVFGSDCEFRRKRQVERREERLLRGGQQQEPCSRGPFLE